MLDLSGKEITRVPVSLKTLVAVVKELQRSVKIVTKLSLVGLDLGKLGQPLGLSLGLPLSLPNAPQVQATRTVITSAQVEEVARSTMLDLSGKEITRVPVSLKTLVAVVKELQRSVKIVTKLSHVGLDLGKLNQPLSLPHAPQVQATRTVITSAQVEEVVRFTMLDLPGKEMTRVPVSLRTLVAVAVELQQSVKIVTKLSL